MVNWLRNELRSLNASFKTGIGLGLGYIFLTLIGIPSEDSVALARIAVPIFLLLAFGLAWQQTRRIPQTQIDKVLLNGVVLGLVAAVVLLLFLGQLNRWQANDLDVVDLYFNKATLYSMQVLSGVPEEELFANPREGVVQLDDETTPLKFRTNPMKLYFREKYAIVTLGFVPIGGLYGLGILLILGGALGGLAQNLITRVQWRKLREQIEAQVVDKQVWHWFMLLMPLWLFILFWTTISQSILLRPFGNLSFERDEIYLLHLKEIFHLTGESLVDETSLQLAIGFSIIIYSILSLRRVRSHDYQLSYLARVLISIDSLMILFWIALWRMKRSSVTFVAPSFHLGKLDDHAYALIAAIGMIIGLFIYVIHTRHDPKRFEFVFTSAWVGISLGFLISLFLIALWRMDDDHIVFVAPSFRHLDGLAYLIIAAIGMIIGLFIYVIRAEHDPDRIKFVRLSAVTGISLGLLISLYLIARGITDKQGTFVLPSLDLAQLDGYSYSLIAVFVVIIALIIFVIRAQRDPNRFEFVFISAVSVALVLMTPLYMDRSQSFVMGRVGSGVMFGLGLNIVIGYAGLLDLGYVAFYAIGAYAFAFLAIENNRGKVALDDLNRLGWMLSTAIFITPLVIFGLATAYKYSRSSQAKAEVDHPRIQRQAPVWDDQPPWYITLGLIVLAVAVALGVERFLTESNILHTKQFSSFLIAIFVAMMIAAFTGIALGIPVLRLRGDYLAIVTLGFGEIISLVLRNLSDTTGGPKGAIGIPKPVPAETGQAISNLVLLYISIIGAVIIIIITLRLRNSRLGRAWLAHSSDEDIAQAMGINLVNVKLLAFSIGASFAGLAGMLFASRQSSIFPDDFGLEVSINVLSLVIIGGMGSVPGVVVGSIVLIGLPELLRPVADYRIMLFGLLLIASMVMLPRGLMPSPPPELEEEARRLAEAEQEQSK